MIWMTVEVLLSDLRREQYIVLPVEIDSPIYLPSFGVFLFTWGTSGLPPRVLAKTLREQNISNNGCNNIIIQVSSVYSKVNVLGFLHFDGRGEPRIGIKTF